MKKHGNTTHGLSGTAEHRIWKGIKSRCNNPNNQAYDRYGGRGISICSEWDNSFLRFLNDMGKRPSDDHSIERIENNNGYSPDNCHWATRKEQMNNTRYNVVLTHQGISLNLTQWAEKLGMSAKTLFTRYYKGYETRRILAPLMRTNGKPR